MSVEFLHAGDPLKESTINHLIGAANAIENAVGSTGVRVSALGGHLSILGTELIKVYNGSVIVKAFSAESAVDGYDILPFQPCGINGQAYSMIRAASQQRVFVERPDPEKHFGKFGIAIDKISKGTGSGRVVIGGLAVAKIIRPLEIGTGTPERIAQKTAFDKLNSQYVDIITDNGQLRTTLAGSGLIVWEEAEETPPTDVTKEHWAIIDVGAGLPEHVLLKFSDDIAAYGAMMVVWDAGNERYFAEEPDADSTNNILVLDGWEAKEDDIRALPIKTIFPVKYDNADEPSAGDSLGTKSGGTEVLRDNVGLFCLGVDATEEKCYARFAYPTSKAKYVKAVSNEAAGVISVKYANSDGSVVGDAFNVKVGA